jgi:hypothetical protein
VHQEQGIWHAWDVWEQLLVRELLWAERPLGREEEPQPLGHPVGYAASSPESLLCDLFSLAVIKSIAYAGESPLARPSGPKTGSPEQVILIAEAV